MVNEILNPLSAAGEEGWKIFKVEIARANPQITMNYEPSSMN